ncbi:MAG: hypothetical protein J7641_06040 [Cyanobacteria bacterium SID2]|nr:hypothetical protein [Cyanobacteria bacterium SID2]MBP0006742.1 hypothetical protein [Cyanobacteria bacterium SBC]
MNDKNTSKAFPQRDWKDETQIENPNDKVLTAHQIYQRESQKLVQTMTDLFVADLMWSISGTGR